jgi:hypothetical protein
MRGVELAVILLAAAAALRVLAGRLNLPHPVLLVLGGLALAAIPGSARDRDAHGAEDADHRALADRDGSGAERDATGYRRLRTAMIDAERRAIIDLRDQHAIGDEVLRRVQRDLDLETMLLESGEDDAPESPYDTF